MFFQLSYSVGDGEVGIEVTLGDGLLVFGPDDRGRRGLRRRRTRDVGRWESEIPPPAAEPNGNAAGGPWLQCCGYVVQDS